MRPSTENISRRHIALGSVGLFIIGGLVLGVFVSFGWKTLAGCGCGTLAGAEVDEDTRTENLCNDFTQKDYVFFTGVLNVYVEKTGKVGVYCVGGEEQGTARTVEERSDYKISSLLPELWAIVVTNVTKPAV